MNISLKSCCLSQLLGESPLLFYPKDNLKISNFKIHFSFSPLLIASKFLYIHKSRFSHYNNQIIHSSSKTSTNFICSCSTFSDISTSNQGSIFQFSNGTIIVKHCIFINIVSLSFPSCFYTFNSDITVYDCIFTKCKAKSGDESYGNCFYTNECNNKVSHVSTKLCSYDKDDSGDSPCALLKPKLGNYKLSNSSYNYGKIGASSVTMRYCIADSVFSSFINVAHSSNHNSFETYSRSNAQLSYANFVNITDSTYVINCYTSNISLKKCSFIDTSKIFFYQIVK